MDNSNELIKNGNRTSDIETLFHIDTQSTVTLLTAVNNTMAQHYNKTNQSN